ncbi:hypothetical protein CM19_11405 [Candidatus Acidianus copahuensis]|uniref:Uncharacterized protein n=2 Tax=Acidianus TaxID=12914 RepID=A0A031LIU9_9CREN|nr:MULTISPECIES: hypothetical protein [Acidianus]EZQ02067.1 hypothetical protein CM19_11405 [Candidatus Acidianus copahuensis]NON62305.1 hypothetical protein [Acidianus sp. RZ1]
MGRVNIAADSELVKELEKEAKSKGYTIFSLTNTAIKAMTDLIKSGEDSSTIQNLVEFYIIGKDLDIIPVTSWYIESLAKICYEKDIKAFEEICEGAGQQLSSYLKSRAPTFDGLMEIYDSVKSVLPIKDIHVKAGSDEEIEIRVTGSGFSKESTFCTSKVFQKILEGYSFNVIEMNYSPGGIIIAKAKYQGQPNK